MSFKKKNKDVSLALSCVQLLKIDNVMKKIMSFILILLLFNLCLNTQNSNNDYPASSEEITITIGKDSIAAFGMFALGKEKKETVILLHGLPGNERSLDLAQELRRNGKNVIYFNYRGSWGSQGEFLYSNCIQDVKEVMDFFDKPENSKAYSQILKILEHAKKNKIFAGIHNGTPEYALKMIDKGFNFVTIGADQRAMSTGAKAIVDKMKGSSNKKEESKAY